VVQQALGEAARCDHPQVKKYVPIETSGDRAARCTRTQESSMTVHRSSIAAATRSASVRLSTQRPPVAG